MACITSWNALFAIFVAKGLQINAANLCACLCARAYYVCGARMHDCTCGMICAHRMCACELMSFAYWPQCGACIS